MKNLISTVKFSRIVIIVAVFLVGGLTMSCEKEEILNTDTKTIEPNPDVQMEIVDLVGEDWNLVDNQTYEATIESSNLGLKSKAVSVYYKLPKLELGTEGLWRELPYDGYSFSVSGSQIIIKRGVNCEETCTFKIEVADVAQAKSKDLTPVNDQITLPRDMDRIDYMD